MYKIPLPELKEKILASKKITPRDLDTRMKEKINELAGLISEEGAAYIIANELGVELISEKAKLKIKELYAGMRSVSTAGKIVRKYETREFAKDGRTGKVCSLVLGDETETIRLVLWNDQADLAAKMQEGDILLLKNAYIKENKGGKELHLGKEGVLEINPPGEIVNTVVSQRDGFERKTIGQLQDNENNVEILGTVVQAFDPHFFQVCSQCGKRALESEGKFQCQEHGVIEPGTSYVMNVVLDDGTGTIRSVFWKNQTHHLLGKEEQDMLYYKANLSLFENIKNELLGEMFKVQGKVKKNEMFGRLEFNVQLVEKANPQEEIARLEKITPTL